MFAIHTAVEVSRGVGGLQLDGASILVQCVVETSRHFQARPQVGQYHCHVLTCQAVRGAELESLSSEGVRDENGS